MSKQQKPWQDKFLGFAYSKDGLWRTERPVRVLGTTITDTLVIRDYPNKERGVALKHLASGEYEEVAVLHLENGLIGGKISLRTPYNCKQLFREQRVNGAKFPLRNFSDAQCLVLRINKQGGKEIRAPRLGEADETVEELLRESHVKSYSQVTINSQGILLGCRIEKEHVEQFTSLFV
jgi:hypothetical protein